MGLFTDMMGRPVNIPEKPKRIVSVVPSQTELLHYLGLEEETVGITKFCVHPDHWFRSKERVGGTKTLHIDKILTLQPDLVFANKEENDREQIEQLASHLPVWVSDIKSIEDALHMISAVGMITGEHERSEKLVSAISTELGQLRDREHTYASRVLYLIWRNPWMAAGADTYISDMLKGAGLENACKTRRYPTLDEEDIKALPVDQVFLSSEPYPFKDEHIEDIQALLPGAKVKLVDGEIFSWYGNRLLPAIKYLRELTTV
jgi:ABC-type Fe3+-hydroxamate transport system substrate-binding protein